LFTQQIITEINATILLQSDSVLNRDAQSQVMVHLNYDFGCPEGHLNRARFDLKAKVWDLIRFALLLIGF